MRIMRVIAGLPDYNAIFELECGVYAMSSVHPEDGVQFAGTEQVFLRHGYFELGENLPRETVDQAGETLLTYLNDQKLLKNCPIFGNRDEIRLVLGLKGEDEA